MIFLFLSFFFPSVYQALTCQQSVCADMAMHWIDDAIDFHSRHSSPHTVVLFRPPTLPPLPPPPPSARNNLIQYEISLIVHSLHQKLKTL